MPVTFISITEINNIKFLLKSKDWTNFKGKKMGKGGESLNRIPNVSPTRALQGLPCIWPKFFLWNAKRDGSPWILWDAGTDDGEGYFLQEKLVSMFPWLSFLILRSLVGGKVGNYFGMSHSSWSTGIWHLWSLGRTF